MSAGSPLGKPTQGKRPQQKVRAVLLISPGALDKPAGETVPVLGAWGAAAAALAAGVSSGATAAEVWLRGGRAAAARSAAAACWTGPASCWLGRRSSSDPAWNHLKAPRAQTFGCILCKSCQYRSLLTHWLPLGWLYHNDGKLISVKEGKELN